MEPLKEFERFMGADQFPPVVSVHHVQHQLLGMYMHASHSLSENAPLWPPAYSPFENRVRSLAPMDYYHDSNSCALDAFNLAVGKVCVSQDARITRHTTGSLLSNRHMTGA